MNIGYKMRSVKSFCEKCDFGDNVCQFIDIKLKTLTKEEALLILKSFYVSDLINISNNDMDAEHMKKLIDIVDDNDLLLQCAYSGDIKHSAGEIINEILDMDIHLSYENGNNEHKTLKKLISNSFGGNDNVNIDFIINVIDHIENTEYVFDMLIRSVSDNKKLKEYISNIIYPFHDINDKTAILIAPYLLNKEHYRDFIDRVENLKILELYVIATKDKEIIAYYIYKSKRYDLIYDLFKNEDIYLKFCTEVFDNECVVKIEEFMRSSGRYKFVDDKIEEYLNKFNEKPDFKFY